jgi:hypothetical protein
MLGNILDFFGYLITAGGWIAKVIFSKKKISDGIRITMSPMRNAVSLNYTDPATVQIYLDVMNNTPVEQTATHFVIRFYHGGTSIQIIPDRSVVIPAQKDVKVYLQANLNPAQSLSMAKTALGGSDPRIDYNIVFSNALHTFEISGTLDNLAVEQINREYRLKAA